MPSISDQVSRTQAFIQDTNADAWTRAQILEQHQNEMARLARERRMGDILVLQGILDQALYTLPDTTLMPAIVLYNGQRLDFATEEFLDRRQPEWELLGTRSPRYWTVDNQNPETLRIAPTPSRTGSLIPQVPPAPFIMSFVDNLVVFLYRDLSDRADNEGDDLPLLDLWEDVLVWRTSAELAQRESPYQNLAASRIARSMTDVWLGAIES